MAKRCPKCGVTSDNFYKNRRNTDGLQSWCTPCKKPLQIELNKKAWQKIKNDPITLAKYLKTCRENNKRFQYRINSNKRLREAAYLAYGRRCVCCGEENLLFLSIDHVNNDGAAHRRSLRSTSTRSYGGVNILAWAKKNNFPPSLQLLCFNCNCGKQRNGGVCPHNDTP